MKYPTTLLINETNFHTAWTRSICHVINNGIDLIIGDASEPKPITDACVLFELTGDAIRQIEARELHPQFPFQHIDPYCEEFTREYQEKYLNFEEDQKFSYTYFDRLTNYNTSRMGYTTFTTDQIETLDRYLSMQISDEISSNRDQAITWRVDDDLGNDSAPCLQRIWIRYLGNNNVEVHLTFRSHDLFSAWQANMIAIIEMLNREIIKPNNCKIVKIIEFNDSLHIYKSDFAAAKKVKSIPVNPQTNYR